MKNRITRTLIALCLTAGCTGAVVTAGPAVAEACGGYSMSPEERRETMARWAIVQHARQVHGENSQVVFEELVVRDTFANARLRITVPTPRGERVRRRWVAFDLRADGVWAPRAARPALASR